MFQRGYVGGRHRTERWQQLVGREFGGKNESKHDVGDERGKRYITLFPRNGEKNAPKEGKGENAAVRPASPCGVFAQAVSVPPFAFFSLLPDYPKEREIFSPAMTFFQTSTSRSRGNQPFARNDALPPVMVHHHRHHRVSSGDEGIAGTDEG